MNPLRLAVQTPSRPKRSRRVRGEFSIPGALKRADEILAGPCAGYLPRVDGRGERVARFVLPLDMCKTTNALISMGRAKQREGRRGFSPAAQMAALEERVFRMMFLQHPSIRSEALSGRPQLRIVRFSSVEPDESADGMKLARDLLRMPVPPRWDPRRNRMTKGTKGFGFLLDDSPRAVETSRWWERIPPGQGFGLIEVWSGGT